MCVYISIYYIYIYVCIYIYMYVYIGEGNARGGKAFVPIVSQSLSKPSRSLGLDLGSQRLSQNLP